jgi:hypothetical protein
MNITLTTETLQTLHSNSSGYGVGQMIPLGAINNMAASDSTITFDLPALWRVAHPDSVGDLGVIKGIWFNSTATKWADPDLSYSFFTGLYDSGFFDSIHPGIMNFGDLEYLANSVNSHFYSCAASGLSFFGAHIGTTGMQWYLNSGSVMVGISRVLPLSDSAWPTYASTPQIDLYYPTGSTQDVVVTDPDPPQNFHAQAGDGDTIYASIRHLSPTYPYTKLSDTTISLNPSFAYAESNRRLFVNFTFNEYNE